MILFRRLEVKKYAICAIEETIL